MQSFVKIDNLEIVAHHGVFPFEREKGNIFLVSVEVEYDFIESALKDNLDNTLNYAELTNLVIEEMSIPRNLIESVTYSIYQRIMEKWPKVKGGCIIICKKYPPLPSPTPEASVKLCW